jgi:ABC-type amino acid transport substrate-binding protein
MWRRLGSGLWLAGACAVAAAAPSCPRPLRIGFNDSATPPGLMGQGTSFAEPPGWEVLAVRDAVKRLGCTVELVRLPSRRLSASLAQGSIDFALLYGITAERLRALRFPLDAQGRPDLAWAPVFGHLVLFGRPGTPADAGWNGRRLASRWRLGVIAGSVQETLARERGWAVEPVAAIDAEVTMLQAGRFDLLLTTRESLTQEQRAGLVEWSPVVARLPYFAPAAPAFAQRHPAWTRLFWNELCQAVRRLEPDARPAECGAVPAAAWRHF